MRASLACAGVVLLVLCGCDRSKTQGVGPLEDAGAGAEDAGLPEDAGEAAPDAGPIDAGSSEDAGTIDAGPTVDAGAPDAGPVDAGPTCPPPPSFDYTCVAGDTTTCPEGFCIGSLCIAPRVDQDRWNDCGNGTCDACETAKSCPVDCATPPAVTGTKEYNNNTTITVWVHGFANNGPAELEKMVYGGLNGCSDLGRAAQAFGENRPCGDVPGNETLPNQIVGVEYYGDVPPTWMTPKDILEVESFPYSGGPLGLQRYGLIVAKFIKWRMQLSGATHVNIACHSMGCLISRYIIENDIEQLASQNKIVRWITSAGVVAGARLSRLYDNPTIRQYSGTIGLEVSDFILMNPDYVRDTAAAWDHQLYEGNSPLFKDMLIHHGGATDPRIPVALNYRLLDTSNPDDEPNDGIMFTFDEFFHKQSPAASRTTPSGEVLSATHSYTYVWHSALPDTDSFGTTAVAAAFHRRKVFVTLKSFTMKKTREYVFPWNGEAGVEPNDISVETEVRYDPYTVPAIGKPVLVHEDKVAYRSADLFPATAGTPLNPGLVLYEGPVFDAQTSFRLKATIVEVDAYPRFKIAEDLTDPSDDLVGLDQVITLQDQVLHIENDWAAADLDVHVVDLY
jgi:hypothetical protein